VLVYGLFQDGFWNQGPRGLGDPHGGGSLVRALRAIQKPAVLGAWRMWGWLAASSAVDRPPVWTIRTLLALGLSIRRGTCCGGNFSGLTIAGLALAPVRGGTGRTAVRFAGGGIAEPGLEWPCGHSDGLVWLPLLGSALLEENWEPWAAIYSPVRPMLLAHLIYGLRCLVSAARWKRRGRQFPEEPAAPGRPGSGVTRGGSPKLPAAIVRMGDSSSVGIGIGWKLAGAPPGRKKSAVERNKSAEVYPGACGC